MFQHSRRGTFVWLLIVGLALVMALVAGGMSTAVGATLVAAYLALALMVARNAQFGEVFESLSHLSARRPQATEIAREAVARARSHAAFDSLFDLLDIGLIVDEQRPDGLSLRRGRFISLEDDGVRPFAILYVSDSVGERFSHVRFELRDETGQPHYVYETEKWLQTGENHLLPDYRFPVRKNTNDLEAGTWSVHLIIDGGVVGVHHFNVSPSLAARRRLLSSDGEIRERVWRTAEEDESLPISLEELLRQQSREYRQS